MSRSAWRLVLICLLLTLLVACGPPAEVEEPEAAPTEPAEEELPFALLPTWHGTDHLDENKVKSIVLDNVPEGGNYRGVSAQVIHDEGESASHILAHFYSAGENRSIDTVMIDVDENWAVTSVNPSYEHAALDQANQPHNHSSAAAPTCPDNAIQFLSVAPLEPYNKGSFQAEKAYAQDVANTAKAKGLVTKELYGNAATVPAVMDVLACPNLEGFFYDGDSNPQLVAFHNGNLTAADITTHFTGKFGGVTNIWLACLAYNDPMLSAMKATGAQVFAAGITTLQVGPSDRTAVCAMKAAINGQPMNQAFDTCDQQNDVPSDKWGWYAGGSNTFGQ